MLCKACLPIFETPVKLGSVRHHSSALELRQAGQTGCQLCQLLWPFVLEGSPNHDVSSEDTSVNYVLQRGKDSTVFGYMDISADLHLLVFSLNTEVDASANDMKRQKLLIVEPMQG